MSRLNRKWTGGRGEAASDLRHKSSGLLAFASPWRTPARLLLELLSCCRTHGGDVPSMDGSAEPFVQLVKQAGIHEMRQARRYLLVRKAVTVTDGDKLARLSPARGSRFAINYTIDFRHPLINDQSYRVDLTEKSFQK